MANSRLNTAVNLDTGATYELLFVNTDSYPNGQLNFNFLSTPRKITGIQKVAQYFVKALMTTVGSDFQNPRFGTNFMRLCSQSNITTDDSDFLSDLKKEIESAESQTQMYMNTTGSDPSSMLDRVEILKLNTDSNTQATFIYLNIVTAAGEYAAVSVPFPQLNLNLAN